MPDDKLSPAQRRFANLDYGDGVRRRAPVAAPAPVVASVQVVAAPPPVDNRPWHEKHPPPMPPGGCADCYGTGKVLCGCTDKQCPVCFDGYYDIDDAHCLSCGGIGRARLPARPWGDRHPAAAAAGILALCCAVVVGLLAMCLSFGTWRDSERRKIVEVPASAATRAAAAP